MLKDKTINLYITGGIAAYKMANFARTLINQGAQVQVAMTPAASQLVSPLTMQVLTKNPVHIDVMEEEVPESVAHIQFAQSADFSVLAPATANTLAKLAQGLADNFVTTALLATPHPIFIVPAMNDYMYSHPATQRNIKQLHADGHHVMEPDTGFLAEGYEGKGRLPEDQAILDSLTHWIIQQKDGLPLVGKRVLVSAGGTVERIDPVRYISNDSSGKMGHAIAQAAYEAGAQVSLVTASQLPASPYIDRIQVASAREMLQALDQRFEEADALIMAAAVSDYTPASPADQKIKKDGSEDDLVLRLEQNPDIIRSLGEKKTKQITVGFAAETENVLDYARKKLKSKYLDLIVANDVSKEGSGFNVDTNEVVILTENGQDLHIPQRSKEEIAREIINQVVKKLKESDHA